MHERNCERAELSLETCICAQNGECRPFLEIQVVKITKSSSFMLLQGKVLQKIIFCKISRNE